MPKKEGGKSLMYHCISRCTGPAPLSDLVLTLLEFKYDFSNELDDLLNISRKYPDVYDLLQSYKKKKCSLYYFYL